jgi:bifunctional DNA-binding transcriptional regulator/antitoxin component of YhaV-PrlF toxin-antitoxin module
VFNIAISEPAMVELVRVRKNFQLTIPSTLRRQLGLRLCDYLEASATAEGIVFRLHRPKPTDAGGSMTLLDFLREPRPHTRTRTEIEAALSADRDSWDR